MTEHDEPSIDPQPGELGEGRVDVPGGAEIAGGRATGGPAGAGSTSGGGPGGMAGGAGGADEQAPEEDAERERASSP